MPVLETVGLRAGYAQLWRGKGGRNALAACIPSVMARLARARRGGWALPPRSGPGRRHLLIGATPRASRRAGRRSVGPARSASEDQARQGGQGQARRGEDAARRGQAGTRQGADEARVRLRRAMARRLEPRPFARLQTDSELPGRGSLALADFSARAHSRRVTRRPTQGGRTHEERTG